MLSKSKAILGAIAAAIALVALTAVPALADPVAVNLAVSTAKATYGQEFTITPAVTGTQTVPGDTFVLQAWSSTESTWALFGEGDMVEDTGTISPQYMLADESFLPWFVGGRWTPTMFRVIYKPASRGKDASGTALPKPPSVTSNTSSLTIAKVKTVKVKNSIPKSAKRKRKCTLTAHTLPNVGVGTMRFTITRKGYRTVVINAKTDDSGYADATYKFAKRGKYKVTSRWLGNRFGAASKTVSSKITVR
jgi:hypothetical protein